MKANLLMMRDAIEQMDNDPTKSLYFYNNPAAKVKLLQDLVNFSVQQIDRIEDPVAAHMRASEISNFLDVHFQQYTWGAHEVHFHTNFNQFASCTFTCLTEISAIIEKVIKEKFSA